MIQELFEALVAKLPPGTPLKLGAEEWERHTSPPLIVLIPRGVSFGAAVGGGGLVQSSPEGQRVERSLLTRVETFEVLIWGRDYTEVEQVSDELVQALWAETHGSLGVLGGEWVEEAGGVTRLGHVLRLRFAVDRPVKRAERWAVLEKWAKECQLQSTV